MRKDESTTQKFKYLATFIVVAKILITKLEKTKSFGSLLDHATKNILDKLPESDSISSIYLLEIVPEAFSD